MGKLRVFLLVIFWLAIITALTIYKQPLLGSIQGKVFDRTTGKPIAGAVIKVEDIETKTGPDGSYFLKGIPINYSQIEAKAQRYDSSSLYDLQLKETKVTSNINFKLAQKKPYLYLASPFHIFTPKEKIMMKVNGVLVTKASFFLYKLDMLKTIHSNYSNLNRLPVSHLKPITAWEQKFNLNEDGEIINPTVHVPAGETGLYVLRVTEKNLQAQVWFAVTSLGLVTKQGSDKVLVYTYDFVTAKPFAGASVRIYQGGKLTISGRTDSSGLCNLQSPEKGNYLVVAQKSNDVAFCYNYISENDPNRLYVYSERPVYRPGHRVYFKGIARQKQGSKYLVLNNKQVKVAVKDPKDNVIYQKTFTTNAHGSFDGDLTLSKEVPIGYYTINTSLDKTANSSNFQVAEYRKAEYKVEVSAGKKVYLKGDTVPATIKATYYFGAPVADAKVKYFVYAQDLSPREEDGLARHEDDSSGYGDLILSGEGITDKNGLVQLSIKTKESLPMKILKTEEVPVSDKIYKIEAEVTDSSNLAVTGKGNFYLAKGTFQLALTPQQTLFSENQPVKIALQTKNYLTAENKPNIPVKVDVQKISWKNGRELTQKVAARRVFTDKKGMAFLTFNDLAKGYYKFTAQTSDERSNLLKEECYVWVAGADFSDSSYDSSELEIVPAKKNYHQGETAKVIINTKFDNSYALITLEGSRLHWYMLRKIKKNTVIEFPIKEEYQPSAYLTVCLVHGKDFITRQVPLQISTRDKELKVTLIPDKESYLPAEKTSWLIKTTDYQGKPVQAEVSLGVVDEAIYAIKEEITQNIKAFFYGEASNLVNTNYSFVRTYSGGPDKDGGSVKIRRNFSDTAFWRPVIITDTDGKATVSFNLPESLTTWRATARGITDITQVGESKKTVITNKKLLVRLITPRYITHQDQVNISGIVHNYTGAEQKVTVTLKAANLQLTGQEAKEITIPRDGQGTIVWTAKGQVPGKAVLTITAKGTTDSDGMEASFPVVPASLSEVVYNVGEVREESKLNFGVPAGAIGEANKLKIWLTPSLTANIMNNIDYLTSYPYGCSEQTTSSLLGNVIVSQTLKVLGRKDKTQEAEITKMVNDGLQRLAKFQHSDGGWGWWEYDTTQPLMTAYVLNGLSEAKKAGFSVSEEMYKNGVSSLKSQLASLMQEKKETKPTQRKENINTAVYMFYALTSSGEKDLSTARELFAKRDWLNNYSKALLALALDRLEQKKDAKTLITELEKTAEETYTTCYWPAKTWLSSWMDNRVETTAYVLKAMVLITPDNPRILKTIRWLTEVRQGNRWNSTKDTAAVVYALGDYLKKANETRPNYLVKVYFNDTLLKTIHINDFIVPEKDRIIVLEGRIIKEGFNTLKLVKEGAGRLYYSTTLTYYPQKEEIKHQISNNIYLKREYFKLIPQRKGETEINYLAKPINEPIALGEKIQVRLTIVAKNSQEYMMIEDPIPPNCEIIEQEDDSYWWANREVRDQKISFFLLNLEKGQTVLTYYLRSQLQGEFRVMPSVFSSMYNPFVMGNSSEHKIISK